jgi:hypothetical protein
VHALREPELARFLASLFKAAANPVGWRAAGLWGSCGDASAPQNTSSSASSSSSNTTTTNSSSTDSFDPDSTAASYSYSYSDSTASLPGPPALSRHDLFHGHLFVSQSGGLGLLMHSNEYPQHDPWAFPFDLGYCQRGSELAYSQRAMDLRNILFYEVGAPFRQPASFNRYHPTRQTPPVIPSPTQPTNTLPAPQTIPPPLGPPRRP